MATRIEQLLFELTAEGRNLKLFQEMRQDLQQLGGQARQAGQQMRQGFAGVDQRLGAVGRQLQAVKAGFVGLISVGGAVQLVGALRELSDEATLVRNRVRAAAESEGEFNTMLAETYDLAREVRGSLLPIASLYSRTAKSIRAFGGTQEQARQVTRLFAQTLRISGASAEEAASATLQFGQALQSGRLAGDEFRSINEANGRLMEALAEGLGVGRDALKDLASEGELTAQRLVQALLSQNDKIESEAKALGATFAEVGNVWRTELTRVVQNFEQASGFSERLASLLIGVSGGMEAVVAAAGVLASVIAGRLVEAFRLWRREIREQRAARQEAARGALQEAQAERANAQAVITNAQAKLAAAQADIRAARAMDRATGSLTQQGIVSRQVVAAHRELTAAKHALAAADARVATASRAAGASVGLFGRAVGFLGGPLGALLTVLTLAGTAFAVFGNRAKTTAEQLAEDTEELNRQVERLLGNYDALERSATEEALEALAIRIRNLRKEKERLNELLELESDVPERLRLNIVSADEIRRQLAENERAQRELFQQRFDLRRKLKGENDKALENEQQHTEDLQREQKKRLEGIQSILNAIQGEYQQANQRLKQVLGERAAFEEQYRKTVEGIRGGGQTVPEDADVNDLVAKQRELQRALEKGDPEQAAAKAREALQIIDKLAETGAATDQYLETQAARINELATGAFQALEAQAKAQVEKVKAENAALVANLQQQAEALKTLPVGFDSEAALKQFKAMVDAMRAYYLENIGALPAPAVGGGATPSAEGSSTPTEGYASGGFVRGRGTGTSDSILAWLSRGEYVLRAAVAQRLGPHFLDRLNRGLLPGFATGGPVYARSLPNLAAGPGGSMRPIHLHLDGREYRVQADQPTARALVGSVLSDLARSHGRRF